LAMAGMAPTSGVGRVRLAAAMVSSQGAHLSESNLGVPTCVTFSFNLDVSMLTRGSVAFCFYNLSSIVNGLVYFDQLSLIPWSYLGLVGLGIIILLGGVWIVSFNSGGGGVNVGTWRDEESDGSGGDSSDTCEGVSPDARGRPGRDAILLERSAISESDASHYFTHDPHPRTSSPGPTNHTPDYISLSQGGVDERPNLSVRTGMQRRRQTNELRSPAQAHHHSVLSPQLPAFSIGISPASPGFVVVPRERRRKVSGMSIDSQMRRSHSEGDILPVPDPVDEGMERTLSASTDLGQSPQISQSSRWRWLQRVFKRDNKTS
jgi:hypothetical protein